MNKEEYSKALLSPEWRKKRLKILNRNHHKGFKWEYNP